MALISCPDCGRKVSDAAASCIGCGRPLLGAAASPPPAGVPERPVLIEKSSKSHKKQLLLGLLGIPVGILVILIGAAVRAEALMTFGLAICVMGVLWFLLNFVFRWWHHG